MLLIQAPTLPMVTQLITGRHVIVDAMTETQLVEIYHMIQDAAAEGNGFGIDEFINENNFRKDIENSHCFAIICKENYELLGGMILASSMFYRGVGTMVDPIIIIKRSARGQNLGEFAMRKAIEISKQLGYVGMYVDTFSNNTSIVKILQKIGGFLQVGFLPIGGRLHNGQLIGSIIFYLDLLELHPCEPETSPQYTLQNKTSSENDLSSGYGSDGEISEEEMYQDNINQYETNLT